MVNWEFMDNQTPESATAAGRRPARRHGGPLHPRPADLHLARGRAGAGRLPRRPRRRGPGRRPRVAGRPAASPASTAGPPAGRTDAGSGPQRHRRPREADTARAESRPSVRTAMTDTLTPVLTDNWDAERSWTLASYEARGGYAALRHGAGHGPRRRHRPRSRTPGLRGRGGAGFPTGMKWGFIPQDNPKPEVPRRQRRRVRAGHLQGHPADDGQPAHPGRGRDHLLLRDPRQHAPSSTCAARSCT